MPRTIEYIHLINPLNCFVSEIELGLFVSPEGSKLQAAVTSRNTQDPVSDNTNSGALCLAEAGSKLRVVYVQTKTIRRVAAGTEFAFADGVPPNNARKVNGGAKGGRVTRAVAANSPNQV